MRKGIIKRNVLTLYSSTASSQDLIKAESSHISAWVSSRCFLFFPMMSDYFRLCLLRDHRFECCFDKRIDIKQEFARKI
jgi:hypothetical protein